MKIKSLASSSSGNCHIVEHDGCRIMLDCGLTKKQLRSKNVKLSELAGCLVSHFHSDHSKGVRDLLKAAVDVYLTEETSKALELPRSHRRHIITPMEYFKVGGFRVAPFLGHHDCEVVGFQISAGGEKLVYITDSCYCQYKFNNITHLLIESNYDADSLEKSVNDPALRRRVIQTHFGLENVIGLLEENDLSKLKEVRLCHLSDANSNEKLMLELVGKVLPEGFKLSGARK
jgi:phosphoribosyl 1,2-cyclic phosphodiesterase